MSWQTDGVTMLRVILNDMCDSPTYSDSKLEQLLVVAAHYVATEIDFTVDYDVSISDMSITPDPTDSPRDEAFMNFIVLKGACFADQGAFRLRSALAGLNAKLGPASLSVGGDVLKGYMAILDKGPCAAYSELKQEWQFGDGATVRAIFSPFCGPNVDIRFRNNYYDGR